MKYGLQALWLIVRYTLHRVGIWRSQLFD